MTTTAIPSPLSRADGTIINPARCWRYYPYRASNTDIDDSSYVSSSTASEVLSGVSRATFPAYAQDEVLGSDDYAVTGLCCLACRCDSVGFLGKTYTPFSSPSFNGLTEVPAYRLSYLDMIEIDVWRAWQLGLWTSSVTLTLTNTWYYTGQGVLAYVRHNGPSSHICNSTSKISVSKSSDSATVTLTDTGILTIA